MFLSHSSFQRAGLATIFIIATSDNATTGQPDNILRLLWRAKIQKMVALRSQNGVLTQYCIKGDRRQLWRAPAALVFPLFRSFVE